MSAPTVAEEKLLVEFRTKVKPILKTDEQQEDAFLIRWLRASNLNLQKAVDMLKASLTWRENNNADNMLQIEQDSIFTSEFPFYVEGIDRNNRPVTFLPIGKWDFRKPTSAGKTKEFTKYIIYMFEKCLEKIKERSKDQDPELFPVTQFISIVDFSGFSYLQLLNVKAVRSMLQIAYMYEEHYPEIFFHAYFINCPSFINAIVTLIKPILGQKTMKRIFTLGTDRTEYENAIREYVDDEQLSKVLKRLDST